MVEIMLDKSPEALAEKSEKFDFRFWQLRTPLTQYRRASVPYGLDNGCFTGVLNPSWYRMIQEAEEDRPKFVAVPDVVGSARRTMDLFTYFERVTNGLPRALVLQDGIGDVEIPWSKISAVFVGGTDAFKTSQEAFAAVKCARMLGKWVHVGRVNEPKRLSQWADYADSIDGSGLSRFDHMLESVLNFLRSGPDQASLL